MNYPVRVLCVFSTLDRGGAESMCMNLYRHIDRTIVQFDFVKHTQATGVFEKEIHALGGKIYSAPRYRVYNHLSYVAWWKRFLAEHPEYTTIHCHYFTMTRMVYSVAKKINRVTIAHAHTTHAYSRVNRLLLKNLEKHTDYCFACSDAAGRWLYPHGEYHVIKNAIDTEQFALNSQASSEVRGELGLGNDLVVGIVGSISTVKNPFGTIEIFKQIHQRNPKAKLLWVGNGQLRGQVEAKLAEEGLAQSVVLTGVREDVHRMLQAMDAFILPSLVEGLPVVAIEAQTAGLRCFISNTVTREADITGRCSFLPLDAPAQWAEELLSTDLTKADTTAQIRAAGYDIRDTSRRLQEFYLRLAEQHGE